MSRPPTLSPPHRILAALALASGLALAPTAARSQGPSASGQMAVRVTVLDPVQPMSLAEQAPMPRIERDPRTGRGVLCLTIASDAVVSAELPGSRTALRPSISSAVVSHSALAAHAWRVDLPAEQLWSGDTLEVRFTSRTGEAETIATIRIPMDTVRRIRTRTVSLARTTREAARD